MYPTFQRYVADVNIVDTIDSTTHFTILHIFISFPKINELTITEDYIFTIDKHHFCRDKW